MLENLESGKKYRKSLNIQKELENLENARKSGKYWNMLKNARKFI